MTYSSKLRYFLPIALSLFVWGAFLLPAASPQSDSNRSISSKVAYDSDIQPLFESRCYLCHGAAAQLGEFRLDRKADALRGGGSGVPAIVPGKSAQSLLIRYVSGVDEKLVMPPEGQRLTTEQVALLRTWIDEGAAWPDDGSVDEHAAIPDGRDHWAFQPRTNPELPEVEPAAFRRRIQNPIDQFVFAKLEARGWKPNPRAKPHQLLRRTYLDLIGLPATIAEQDAFYNDPSPEALAARVDDLLARPGYGERWGRHWLDLVRYAETNGYERDAIKPHVWRFRDYVIRAFNDDKPFDRFVVEQLAGDELADRDAETLTATGYNRLGPWDDEPADPATDRYDQLDDLVSTTAQVYLGLTLGCARCHNHKFEPLSAQDYYSFLAIFDPLQRPRNGRRELALPIGKPAEVERVNRRDAKIKPLEEVIAKIREDVRKDFLVRGESKLGAEVTKAFRTNPRELSVEQRKLVKKHQTDLDVEIARWFPRDKRRRIESLENIICELQEETPDLPRGYFLNEPEPEPPVTHLLIRGKAGSHGPEVEAAVPAVLNSVWTPLATPALHQSGSKPETSRRRLSLARWIADPANPLTARVIVNRVWQFHFGEGLVRTPSDFGVMGQEPTHPELLDWLANWFVDNGWSLKKLHRLIMTSATYAMSKSWSDAYGEVDPESRLLWRFPYRRLEVEAIRDSMLAVSGRLNREMYGPSMYPFVPAPALEGHPDPDKIWKPFREDEASRRTIYAFVKRSMIVPMLEVLDLCDTTRTSARRVNTSVAPQALTLFNGDFVNRQARHWARRLVEEAGSDPNRQIERAYRLALARPPTEKERRSLIEFRARESKKLRQEQPDLLPDEVEHKALVQICRVILNLNEFVYTD